MKAPLRKPFRALNFSFLNYEEVNDTVTTEITLLCLKWNLWALFIAFANSKSNFLWGKVQVLSYRLQFIKRWPTHGKECKWLGLYSLYPTWRASYGLCPLLEFMCSTILLLIEFIKQCNIISKTSLFYVY